MNITGQINRLFSTSSSIDSIFESIIVDGSSSYNVYNNEMGYYEAYSVIPLSVGYRFRNSDGFETYSSFTVDVHSVFPKLGDNLLPVQKDNILSMGSSMLCFDAVKGISLSSIVGRTTYHALRLSQSLPYVINSPVDLPEDCVSFDVLLFIKADGGYYPQINLDLPLQVGASVLPYKYRS